MSDVAAVLLADRGEPLQRMRRARLHAPRQIGIERRHRDRDLDQAVGRQSREQIDIALDEVRLGDDADGMAESGENRQYGPRHAVRPLDRLVRVRRRTERDGARRIAGRAEFPFEQRGCIRFDEELRLEIKTRRESGEGMVRPREAVDAAVLAAAIRVDRAVEADVGRGVARDDAARPLGRHLCPSLRRRGLVRPAVVEGLVMDRFETTIRVGGRAAARPCLSEGAARRETTRDLGRIRFGWCHVTDLLSFASV